MTLEDLMQHMKSRGFEATSAQYKRQFKKWSLSKNLRSEEWIYISRIINRRLRDGKQTNVLFHGRILEEAQVRKEIRRHDLPTLRQGPVISTAPNIRLCTPPNSNAQDISFPVFTTFPSLEFVQLVNLKAQGLTHEFKFGGTGRYDYDLHLGSSALETFKLCTDIISVECTAKEYLQQHFPADGRIFDLTSSRRDTVAFEDRTELCLVKLIVLLSANSLLQHKVDDTFNFLIGTLQDIHPMEQFLNLIISYNLYYLLETLLDLHRVTTEIFAGNALLHAVELGETRLSSHSFGDCCRSPEYSDDQELASRTAQLGAGDIFKLVLDYIDHYCADLSLDLKDPVLKLFVASLQDNQVAIDSLIYQTNPEHAKNRILEGILYDHCMHKHCLLPKISTQCQVLLVSLMERGVKSPRLAWFMAEEAIRNSDTQTLTAALRLGLDINDPELRLLYCAVEQQKLDVSRFLIANGANPYMTFSRTTDCPSCTDKSPFERAALSGDLEIIKISIQQSSHCDSTIITKSLKIVLKHDNPQLLENFLDLVRIEHPSLSTLLESKEYLEQVFYGERIRVFQWLLSRGYNIEPLMSFLKYIDRPVNSFLFDHLDGHHVCKSREMFRALLDIGVPPTEQLLIRCASSPWPFNDENMEVILQKRKQMGWNTSLELFENCYKALLWLGRNDVYSSGSTAFSVSSLRFLQKQGVVMERWLLRLLELPQESMDREYFQSADITYLADSLIAMVFFHGSSPFLMAVYMKDMKDTTWVRQLLLDETPVEGLYPPLTYNRVTIQGAAGNGKRGVVRLLLDAGADPNCRPYPAHGFTALQIASIRGYIQIALDLLHAGADVNIPAGLLDGRTALEGAAENGRLDMVYLLVNHNTNSQQLLLDCKRAARLAMSNGHSTIAKVLRRHAEKISKRLNVRHDEIDELCKCHIERLESCDQCGDSYYKERIGVTTRRQWEERGGVEWRKHLFNVAFGSGWNQSNPRQ